MSNFQGNVNKFLVQQDFSAETDYLDDSIDTAPPCQYLNDTMQTIQSDPGPSTSMVREEVDTTSFSHQDVDVAEVTRRQLLKMGIDIEDNRASGDKSYR